MAVFEVGELFLFFFSFFNRNSQNNHRTAGYFLALTCVVPDKIDLENKYIFACSHKKATKRAILFAVMNNEAPVITGESEGACCVRPRIHQQPSDRLTHLQQVKTCPEVTRGQTQNHRVIVFFFSFLTDNKDAFEYGEHLCTTGAQLPR